MCVEYLDTSQETTDDDGDDGDHGADDDEAPPLGKVLGHYRGAEWAPELHWGLGGGPLEDVALGGVKRAGSSQAISPDGLGFSCSHRNPQISGL